MKNIERRDFLKFMAAIPTSMVLSKLISHIENSTSSAPNIIVIVLDALTARNMSLYGYPRQTTPNIERFAARSNVYHSHYSAGTYTTPGTDRVGLCPLRHAAIQQCDRQRHRHGRGRQEDVQAAAQLHAA